MDQGLPGGRGPKFGRDGLVNQAEAYDTRRRLQPREDEWVVTNDDLYDDAVLGVHLPAINTLYLSWIRTKNFNPLGFHAKLKKARLSVVIGALQTFLSSAVYSFDSVTNEVALVPGSQVEFSTEDDETLEEKEVDFELKPEGRYLIGVYGESLDPAFRGMSTASVTRLVPGYTLEYPTMPKRFVLSSATKDYTMMTISVAYLSVQAARVL